MKYLKCHWQCALDNYAIVSVYINVQCIIFMFNYIVSTILTSSTSSVSVHNDGFMEYNKWKNECYNKALSVSPNIQVKHKIVFQPLIILCFISMECAL